MIISVALFSVAEARRKHARWLERPYEWAFWRVPRRNFRVPLPSVWGLEPLQRLAASLELTGRVCAPVPESAFFEYEPSAWYLRSRANAVSIANLADTGSLERFPELLGRHSPVALPHAPFSDSDREPTEQVRALPALVEELQGLVAILRNERTWSRYSVEWASGHALLDLCNEALQREMGTVFYPEWPQLQPQPATRFSTMAVRGLHRIRSVRVLDGGERAEVVMVGGDVFTLRAEDAFQERGRGSLISRATVGPHRAIVLLTDPRGMKVQLTPHRILHIADPSFSDD